MADTQDSKVVVCRSIPAAASDIFDILSDPGKHQAFDGSGFVRGAVKPQRLTGTGQVFRMDMTGDHMGGDYQTDNTVVGFDQNKLIAWKTAPADTEPPGWEWVWELTPDGPDATDVQLTYDWSQVDDPALLKKVKFPLVKPEQLESSLERLSQAVGG